MPSFVNQPVLQIEHIKPAAMSWDEVGSSIDGGRNGLGYTQTIEISGGGILIGRYECGGIEPGSHQYFNYLASRCNGSYRFINVPILNDGSGPFPRSLNGTPQPIIKGIPHSDTALFSDGSGYSQKVVFGRVGANAALGAGELVLQVFGANRKLSFSEWFSIPHSVKGHRAYRAYEPSDPVDVEVEINGTEYEGKQYVVRVSRPLRQAVAEGTRVEIVRPLCIMKFPVDFTLPWDVGDRWVTRPVLEFEEAF